MTSCAHPSVAVDPKDWGYERGNPGGPIYYRACCRECGEQFWVRAPHDDERRAWTNEDVEDGTYHAVADHPEEA